MRRNPLLHWLLMMATLGQYGFVWGFKLASEVSRLSPEAPIHVQKYARIFGVAYIIYLCAVVSLSVRVWRAGPSLSLDFAFWPTYLLGVTLVGYFIWLLTRIAKQLRRFSQSVSPRTSTVIFLSFIWMASLPLLQSYANKMPNQ